MMHETSIRARRAPHNGGNTMLRVHHSHISNHSQIIIGEIAEGQRPDDSLTNIACNLERLDPSIRTAQ